MATDALQGPPQTTKQTIPDTGPPVLSEKAPAWNRSLHSEEVDRSWTQVTIAGTLPRPHMSKSCNPGHWEIDFPSTCSILLHVAAPALQTVPVCQRVAVFRNGLCPDKRPLHRRAAVLCPDLRRLLLQEPGVCEASQKTATRGGSGRPVAALAVGAPVVVAALVAAVG